MKINGELLSTLAVYPSMMTVPDCVVVGSNKLSGCDGRRYQETVQQVQPGGEYLLWGPGLRMEK